MKQVKLCVKCNANEQRETHKYCYDCHAKYMRNWRITHPLNKEQRKKDTARSYANVYKQRGKLKKQPCKMCGSEHSQMHHPDYDKPLEVLWLCRRCHLLTHEIDDLLKGLERPI